MRCDEKKKSAIYLFYTVYVFTNTQLCVEKRFHNKEYEKYLVRIWKISCCNSILPHLTSF